ncbi:MAG: hypothetical protein K0U52_09245 [Gammaproteobacteria bacterium]|nr:hypothetical protein [Gammaproteobacteria bacterium]
MATIFLGMPSEMYASAWSYVQTFLGFVIFAVEYFGERILGETQKGFWNSFKEQATVVSSNDYIKTAVGLCAARQLWKHGLGAASDALSGLKEWGFGKSDLKKMEDLCGDENGEKLYNEINVIQGKTFEEKFDKYRQQRLEKFRAESPLNRKEFIGAIVVLATATLYCVANDVSYLSELPFAFAFAGMLIYRVVEDEIDDAFQRFVCERTATD